MEWPCLWRSHASCGQRGLTNENQIAGEAVLARKATAPCTHSWLAILSASSLPPPFPGEEVVI